MKKRYCLISHTHWDREWYLPFENFRMRLVDLIDNLLDILKEDKEYRFHLDAQTIVLEDYLAIRPSRKRELEDHIRHGRILVGPWYVQNDFHLTDGEATVRNLMIGTEMAGEFGASMPIGYAADQFGLISQLPQILYKAGLRDCVFGRGFDRGTTEFFWETEDGSKVLCEHMRFWYNNAQRLSPDPEGALNLVRNCGRNCTAANCATGNYLLMNGVDHLEAQEDLTEIMDKVRPTLDEDEEIFQDTLHEFMQRLRREVEENGIELKTFRGEFRDNGAANVLTGTLSSRTYLKQANARSQVELERELEPLCTLLSAAGIKDYPHDYLHYLWKLLIENHPHDSICGCSVDAVHEHMMDRFDRIHENTTDLFSRAMDELSSHLEPLKIDGEYKIILLNATSRASDAPVRAVVDVMKEEDRGGIELYDENGNTVPFVYEKCEPDVGRRILSPINLPGESRVARYTIVVDAGVIEGYSYRTLSVKVSDKSAVEAGISDCAADVMKNENLRVKINSDGTADVTDKRSGREYKNLLAFEDTADRGTLYNYVHGNPTGDITTYGTKAEITAIENNELIQKRTVKLTIKADREEASGEIGITMTLTLAKGAEMLDVQLEIDNALENHRLRALVPTGIKADSNFASQPYDVLERSKVSIYPYDSDHPSSDFVAVEGDGHGIALFHDGLYEYEQMTDENDSLALTVLRSVGRITGEWEERNTMTQLWVTPGGQCIGKNTAHFAVMPYEGDHVKAELAAKAMQFLSPVYSASRSRDPNKFIGGRPFVQGPGMPDLFYRPVKNAEKKLPQSASIIKLESAENAVVVTAVKESVKGGIIVRAYNSTSSERKFSLECPLFGIKKAQSVSLLENEVYEELTVDSGRVEYIAKSKEIVTVHIR